MEIVLKVGPEHLERAHELLTAHVAQTLPAAAAKIEQVFPGLTQGNRARMFTVKLPGSLSPAAVNQLLSNLRSDAAIEYADLPAPKQAMGTG